MALSKIDLCSKALLKIGAFPISSFDGDTPEQIISDHLYYVVKHQLLSEYNWSFATIQRELNMINAKPLFNFKYVFTLPEDVISVITADNLCGGKIDYKIVKDELHTNSDNVLLKYVYDCPEEYFSSDFITLIIEKLAGEFAIPLTENTAKANYFLNNANLLLLKAKSKDGLQKKPSSIKNFVLSDVR